jgi:hydrogenase maturation factor
MCITLPWRVVSVDGERIVVESAGVRQEALCFDIADLQPGDAVVVAGSVAVRRLSNDQAVAIERVLDSRAGP